MKGLHVALVGNPNSGKSSLFNALTGLRQKVGNFPGVTVDKKMGISNISSTLKAEIIDLPGTYSLYPRRADEFVTFNVLLDQNREEHPDIAVIVTDASNLKRNLMLASQVIDLQMPCIMALNMLDVAKAEGLEIDIPLLQKRLGIPVVAVNGRVGEGIEELKEAITSQIGKASSPVTDTAHLSPDITTAIQSLTHDHSSYSALLTANFYQHLYCIDAMQKGAIKNLVTQHKFIAAGVQAKDIIQRHDFNNNIVSEVLHSKVMLATRTASQRTARIDAVLTHPLWGYLIFLGILFVVFQAIFTWAQYPMDAIEGAFNSLQIFLKDVLPAGYLTRLFVDGVMSGIKGVAVFVPQIMLLSGFITIMEDTGYLSRVSYMMDKVMRQFGLSGKSVMPMMSGFACAISAIMSTRNIENKKDRLITMMITPLMSCSARLPVYALLVGMIAPNSYLWGILSVKGLIMMGMYLAGFVVALLVAVVLKWVIRVKEHSYFMLELPLYRTPRWKNVGVTMIVRARMFVTDAGKIIVIISVLLWFLSSFAPGHTMQNIESAYQDSTRLHSEKAASYSLQRQSAMLRNSYAGRMGRFIEPAIAPLGFNWQIGISLITSFAAREVFVGTMSTIYSVGEDKNTERIKIREKMQAEVNPITHKPVYTAATALSLMLFFAFAMQCMSTMAVMHRETKSWKWPAIQFLYMLVLAYGISWVAYHFASALT